MNTRSLLQSAQRRDQLTRYQRSDIAAIRRECGSQLQRQPALSHGEVGIRAISVKWRGRWDIVPRLARVACGPDHRDVERVDPSRTGITAMTTPHSYSIHPIGFIRSELKNRSDAPLQGNEGAPDAWLEVAERCAEALADIVVGDQLIIITWLHQARRDTLKVHPRGNQRAPFTDVFATRSPDRPNPLGLHRITVRKIVGNRIRIGPIEAIDGTAVIDIKPVIASDDR